MFTKVISEVYPENNFKTQPAPSKDANRNQMTWD